MSYFDARVAGVCGVSCAFWIHPFAVSTSAADFWRNICRVNENNFLAETLAYLSIDPAIINLKLSFSGIPKPSIPTKESLAVMTIVLLCVQLSNESSKMFCCALIAFYLCEIENVDSSNEITDRALPALTQNSESNRHWQFDSRMPSLIKIKLRVYLFLIQLIGNPQVSCRNETMNFVN